MVKGHSKKIVAFMLSSANSFNFDTTNIWLNGKIGLELKFGIVNFKMLSNEKKITGFTSSRGMDIAQE